MSFKKLHVAVAAGAVISGVVVGGVAQASRSADSHPSYRTTEDGKTYGQLRDAKGATQDELPDLLKVVGNDGLVGYAYTDELLGELAPNPEEALRQQQSAQDEQEIPVYDLEGNAIDTFTVISSNDGVIERRSDGSAVVR